jgi:hypothetical protein
MIIDKGGIFKNSSGAKSGAPLNVADSIRINNGGRFVHNTARSHASNVAVLSIAAGTEEGIFEFDIPDASSTISLSDRNFGVLVLSASAFAGPLNYTGAGTNPLNIRNDLVINDGVTLSLNMSDTIFIGRDYIQHKAIVNLASTNRMLVVSIKNNIIVEATGTITETGSSQPEILITGNSNHTINIQGTILNNISFKLNSASVTKLLSPLSLPYCLKLVKGIVATSDTNMLSLLGGCIIQTDSSTDAFIDGPLRKKGLLSDSAFLFPVGKSLRRWIMLKNVTGDFTVEFHKKNPYILDTDVGAGIDHISSLEYWTIEAGDSGMHQANIELSFNNVNSGGVTDLRDLRVAHLSNGAWENAGNTGTTGTAGASGSVVSNFISKMDSKYFTLSSNSANQNPLPGKLFSFSGYLINNIVRLNWEISPDAEILHFEIQTSTGPGNYNTIGKVNGIQKTYSFYDNRPFPGIQYYRLKIFDKNEVYYSKTIAIGKNKYPVVLAITNSTDFRELNVRVVSSVKQLFVFVITDINGIMVKKFKSSIPQGNSILNFPVIQLPAGLYGIFGVSSTSQTNFLRFLKF